MSCFRYHKGTDFQANHNMASNSAVSSIVVLDTTKVLIFKQITTKVMFLLKINCCFRYHKGTDFQANHNNSSIKLNKLRSCFRYHKGTDFQANHNLASSMNNLCLVVLDTTKVLIFKQITTVLKLLAFTASLF